jgi:hypothetical protein
MRACPSSLVNWNTGEIVEYFFRLIARIGEYAERSQRERDEAYLEQAADLHDLELRMRELERATAHPNWPGA